MKILNCHLELTVGHPEFISGSESDSGSIMYNYNRDPETSSG